MSWSVGIAAALCAIAITLPTAMTAQNRCPVVGDTVTLTGQVSIVHSGELSLPDLHLMVFPNRIQPICILVKPYIGAGVGRVDRLVPNLAHIWLVWPQQEHNGVVDWKHPVPIVTSTFLEITGKITGQGDSGIDDSHVPFSAKSAITLEVINLKNVDAEVNGALDEWRDECNQWIQAQLTVWTSKPGTRAEIFHGRHSRDIDPFATVNGIPFPKCTATFQVHDANGDRSINVARFPWGINNAGGIAAPSP